MVSVNWGIFDRIRTFMNTKAGSSFWSIFFWSNSCRHVSDDLCKGWRISSGVKTKLFLFGRLVVHGGWVQNGQGRRANAVLEKKKKHIYFPLFLFDADVSKRLDFTHFLLGYIPFRMGYSLCVRACVQGLGHDRARLEEGWCQSSGGARGNGLGGEFRTYDPPWHWNILKLRVSWVLSWSILPAWVASWTALAWLQTVVWTWELHKMQKDANKD